MEFSPKFIIFTLKLFKSRCWRLYPLAFAEGCQRHQHLDFVIMPGLEIKIFVVCIECTLYYILSVHALYSVWHHNPNPATINSIFASSYCCEIKYVFFIIIQVPLSSEGKRYWEYMDSSITEPFLNTIVNEFLKILNHCPSRLRKLKNYRVSICFCFIAEYYTIMAPSYP